MTGEVKPHGVKEFDAKSRTSALLDSDVGVHTTSTSSTGMLRTYEYSYRDVDSI